MNPRTDWSEWKRLLQQAGIRDGRPRRRTPAPSMGRPAFPQVNDGGGVILNPRWSYPTRFRGLGPGVQAVSWNAGRAQQPRERTMQDDGE